MICNALRKSLALIGVAAALCGCALAATMEIDSRAVSCLSQADFHEQATALEGIYVSSVPNGVCHVRYGTRLLCEGDVLPASALDELRVEPLGNEAEASLYYRPIFSNGIGTAQQLKFTLRHGKNTAPAAEDSELETYKNISNTGTLHATDPDGDSMTYTLVREPRRGSVELHEDGSFTYTPKENKVGKDSFVFTATDSAGNVSQEATVKIRIVKPTDRAVYADLAPDQQYLGMWLRERGVYTGKTVAGQLCFAPEESITRGEFLVMAVSLLGDGPEQADLTSGFADEAVTPQWMQPYIVSALRSGAVSGTADENGIFFRPVSALTAAEAAVMVQGIVDLPESDASTVFFEQTDSPVPVWAQSAVGALTHAGIAPDMTDPEAPISRLSAAQMLYDAYALAALQSRPSA